MPRRRDTTARLWPRDGTADGAERRDEFLRELRLGARDGLIAALQEARHIPGTTPKMVYAQLVPDLLTRFAKEARDAGLSDRDVDRFVDAFRAAFEDVRREFGI